MTTLPLDDLYRLLHGRLERIVQAGVGAPEAVTEDACQFAWGRLVGHWDELQRHEAVLSWLSTTAIREARRLLRRDQKELSFEVLDQAPAPLVPLPTPHDVAERRERLNALNGLPVRQQRALWLQGLGLSYREIAAHERCTHRTVERQLLRARQNLGRVA